MDRKLAESDNNYSYNVCVIEYMNHSLAAARALGLQFLDGWEIPSHSRSATYSDQLLDFTTAIDHFKVQVQVEHALGHYQFSVALDEIDKKKIRHLVEQIKAAIEGTSLSVSKKERLLNKLNAFLGEVDRDRTGFESFSDLVIGVAHLGGEAARELEPVRKWIDSISRLLGKAKEFEDSTTQLPSPNETRRIPGPKKQLPPPADSESEDPSDEIPF